jgi:hypothetical protein
MSIARLHLELGVGHLHLRQVVTPPISRLLFPPTPLLGHATSPAAAVHHPQPALPSLTVDVQLISPVFNRLELTHLTLCCAKPLPASLFVLRP